MSVETELLSEMVADVLARHGEPDALWAQFAALGLIEDATVDDAALVLRLVAAATAPIPYAETVLLAGWLRDLAGLPRSSEPATVRIGRDAPWAAGATEVLALVPASGAWAVVRLRDGEPEHVALVDATPDDLLRRAAATRVVMIAGALDAVLALTLDHVTIRHQFGRPLFAFQSVKHQLARLAEEAFAARSAADVVIDRLDDEFTVAAAKIRAAMAATTGARIAHQLHGAIGMTREYRLGQLTERLWAWRDEYGTQREWQQRLGRMVQGGDALWEQLTA